MTRKRATSSIDQAYLWIGTRSGIGHMRHPDASCRHERHPDPPRRPARPPPPAPPPRAPPTLPVDQLDRLDQRDRLVTGVRAAVDRHADWSQTARSVADQLRAHLP